MKYCRKCGFQLNDDDAFCPGCGSAQSQVGVVSQQAVSDIPTVSQRQKTLDELDGLMRYFNIKQNEYDKYDELLKEIHRRNTIIADYSPMRQFFYAVLAIIITLLISLLLASIVKGPESSVIYIIGLVIGCGVAYVIYFGFRKKIYSISSELPTLYKRVDEVAGRLVEYYGSYENCTIGMEYTNPRILGKLRSIVYVGRADTIKESINIMIGDAHRSEMELRAMQTAYAAQRAANSAEVAAWFHVADFFL